LYNSVDETFLKIISILIATSHILFFSEPVSPLRILKLNLNNISEICSYLAEHIVPLYYKYQLFNAV